jgi:hypothetical protein
VRPLPVSAGALALFDDGLDRLDRRSQPGDGYQLRHAVGNGEVPRRRLRVRRADEDLRLSVAVDQAAQPSLDPVVQLPDAGEGLRRRQDERSSQRRRRWPGLLQLAGHRRNVHAFRPLDVEESLQRPFAERRQGQLDLGLVGGALGKVVATETRRPPEGCEQVVDQGQMDHLLLRDLVDRSLPPRHDGHLRGRQPRSGVGPQAKRRVQIGAAGGMLELGRLSQQVQQLLAALDDQLVRWAGGRARLR